MANGSRVPINLSIAATAAGAAWIFVFEWVNLSRTLPASLSPDPTSKWPKGGKICFLGGRLIGRGRILTKIVTTINWGERETYQTDEWEGSKFLRGN